MVNLKEHTGWQAEKISDGVIRNVKILGAISSNKRAYPQTTRQAAVKLFEGAKVNLDHPDSPTDVSIMSRFGKLVNVHDTVDGTYADLHYLTKHPMAAAIVEAAETMPDALGMSMQGLGEGEKEDKDGNIVIESISKVFSCDLVANPATVRGLYEAQATMDVQDVEQEPQEQMSSKDAHKQGVKDAIAALLDEESELEACMSKVKQLLQGHYKVFGSDADGGEDGGDAADASDGEAKYEDGKEDKPDVEEKENTDWQKELVALREQVAELQRKAIVKQPRSYDAPSVPQVQKDLGYYNTLLRGN